MPPLPADPATLVPLNRFLTPATYQALVDWMVLNDRVPTPAEVETITGLTPSPNTPTTSPLPDGFAGRDWNNPDWLEKLQPSQS